MKEYITEFISSYSVQNPAHTAASNRNAHGTVHCDECGRDLVAEKERERGFCTPCVSFTTEDYWPDEWEDERDC